MPPQQQQQQHQGTPPLSGTPGPNGPASSAAAVYAQQQQQQQYLQRMQQGSTAAVPPPGGSMFELQSDGNDGLRQAKRRRPTDRSLPSFDYTPTPTSDDNLTATRFNSSTQSLRSLSQEYSKLQQIERKLDWNLSRKKIELQEALTNLRFSGVKKILRVHLQISSLDQPSQLAQNSQLDQVQPPPEPAAATTAAPTEPFPTTEESTGSKEATTTVGEMKKEEENEPKSAEAPTTTKTPPTTTEPDFPKGAGVPRFTVKVSGELLEELEGMPKRPLTYFASRVVLDTDRNPALYDRTGSIEWTRPAPAPGAPVPPLPHAVSVSFPTSTPTKLILSLYLDSRPERFALAPEVASLLDMKTGDRIGVLQALWSYVKMQGLQDPDMKHIRTDQRLRKLFSGQERIPFHHLPEYVNRFLLPHPPTIITHQIDLSQPSTHAAYDIPIYVEDPARLDLEKTMIGLSSTNPIMMSELPRFDESIATKALEIKEANSKRNFLIAFANEPSTVIEKWIDSQANDLNQIMKPGIEVRGSRAAIGGRAGWREEARRSENWEGDWVKEGASVWAQRGFEAKIRNELGAPQAAQQLAANGQARAAGRR